MAVLKDLFALEEELIIFLRNSDILTVSERGVTTSSDSFSGDGHTLTFTLSKVNVKNVRIVSVNSVTKQRYIDYTINYEDTSPSSAPIVTFYSAPPAGSNNVVVSYDYGSDKIFTDYPRIDLTIASYPRVSVCASDVRSKPFGIGGKSIISDILIEMRTYSESSNQLDSILTAARNAITQNQTGFYYFRVITPQGVTGVFKEEGRHQKILGRIQTFLISNMYETA